MENEAAAAVEEKAVGLNAPACSARRVAGIPVAGALRGLAAKCVSLTLAVIVLQCRRDWTKVAADDNEKKKGYFRNITCTHLFWWFLLLF